MHSYEWIGDIIVPLLIINCTNRKRVKASADLDAKTLSPGSPYEVAQEWRTRVSQTVGRHCANYLYCGRSFSESVVASKRLNADLWIVSAGMGLISADDMIPAYNLSVSNKMCSPGAHMSGSWDPTLWWEDANKIWSPTRSISKLISDNSTSLAIVGLSGPYLDMVHHDLQQITPTERDRVRLIVHPANRNAVPALDRNIMPYDERLDGPDSSFRGTRNDFVARAANHFCSLLVNNCDRSVNYHRDLVARSLSTLQHTQRIRREQRNDTEIVQLIIRNWADAHGRSGRMLRILRNKEAVSCEQNRFRRLFHTAANEITIQEQQ